MRFRLDPDIWLSPLMVLGTQWYILFNVIAGASAFPTDLRDVAPTCAPARLAVVAQGHRCPAIFPYYVTGALTASGGSWNASIVAEVGELGRHPARGRRPRLLYRRGDAPPATIRASCWHRRDVRLIVVVINRLFWRPLYRLAERRFRLD